MSDQFFWYVTRSAALVAWVAAAASILVGLTTSSRVLGRRPTIPWLVDLHRLFAAMSVSFLGVHMASLWFDSFVRFRFDDLLIPWVADVPGLTRTSLALGVIAAWLLAAVQVSSLVKDRLTDRVWRSIHLLSFGTLLLGTLHAIQAGSDTDNPLVLSIGMSMLTAIVLATLVRLVRYGQQRQYASADPSPEPEPAHGEQHREPMPVTAQQIDRQQQPQVQQQRGPLQQQQIRQRQQPEPGRVPQQVQQPGQGVRPMPPPHRRQPNDSGGRPG